MRGAGAALAAVSVLALACGDDGGTGGGAATEGAGGGSATSTSSSGTGGAGATTTGTGGGGGGPPEGKVAVFVAQGHVGTTLVSCDDGASWTALRSFDAEGHALVCDEVASVRCFEGACRFVENDACVDTASNCDCDHHPGSGKGLAYGDGAFVATFGWGRPGVVLRSTDAVSWTEVGAGRTFADVAAGNGMIALSDRTPEVSTDAGLTFAPTTDAEHVPWNVRRLFYFADSERFLQAAASGDEHDVRLTGDFTSWTSPSVVPAACLPVASATEGDGVIVTRGPSVCRSTDGGDTFEVATLPGATETFSGPVHDGEAFLVWGTIDGASTVYRSADGVSFTATATNLAGGNRFGEVARNPVTGTMVAARSEWMGWYEDMRWYRSDDGVTWETLAGGPETHPINELVFGWADPSDACPL